MTLLISAPDFAFCSHNLTAAPENTDFGVGVTAGASNADGSTVSIVSALAHDVEYLVLSFSGFGPGGASGLNSSTLLDIFIDPAGGTSWNGAALIDDLLVGGTHTITIDSSTTTNGPPLIYSFPLWIPAGASIGARARTAHSSTITGRVVAYCYGGNRNPGTWWCGRKVTSYGITEASSLGTQHTPGASGVFSSWASLGSTLTLDGQAAQWAVQGEGDTAWTQGVYHFEFGISSARIGPPIVKGIGAGEIGSTFPSGVIFHRFPSGSQLQVRAMAAGASPQPIDVAAYIVS